MFTDEKEREDAEVPGSSLADIAFLLLIFFLLVTTIDVDTGIGLVLPPAPDPNVEPPPIKEKNMFKILVNSQGMILIEEQPASINEVKPKLKEFVTNRGQDPTSSDSPQKAIVSIKTTRQTPYSVYIDMLDEVMGAYAELRNEVALRQFGVKYENLDSEKQSVVKEEIPKKISIAEPDEGS